MLIFYNKVFTTLLTRKFYTKDMKKFYVARRDTHVHSTLLSFDYVLSPLRETCGLIHFSGVDVINDHHHMLTDTPRSPSLRALVDFKIDLKNCPLRFIVVSVNL
jgi:hypothetical protein